MSENWNLAPNPCQEQEQTIDQLRVQLAGCGVAALGGTDPAQVARPGDYGWSPAYQDVLELRVRLEAAERGWGGFLDLSARQALLLDEWLRTPFFETREEWERWVADFRPRVEVALREAVSAAAHGEEE